MPNPPRITHEKLMKLKHDNSIFFERKMPVAHLAAPLMLLCSFISQRNKLPSFSLICLEQHSPVNRGPTVLSAGEELAYQISPLAQTYVTP